MRDRLAAGRADHLDERHAMMTRTFDFDLNRPKPRTYRRVAIDLETTLIAPMVQAPNVVALGFAIDGGPVHVVMANDARFDTIVEILFTDPALQLFAHNAKFDIAALMAHGARIGKGVEWAQMLLGALHDDKVQCTLIRESLIRIALANPMEAHLPYDLGSCCRKWRTPTQPNKLDPYRTLWGTLAHLTCEQLPADARKYLDEDVRSVDELFLAQEAKKAWLKDSARQTRASVALQLMSCWGLRTDPAAVEELIRLTRQELADAERIAKAAGLVREDGSRAKLAAEAMMIQVFEARGEAVPRGEATAKMREKARADAESASLRGLLASGLSELAARELAELDGSTAAERCLGNVKLDEEACEKSRDERLIAYSKVGQANTLLGRVERLRHPVIQPSFVTLMNTGRTSCRQGDDPKPGEAPRAYGAQTQNVPRGEGMRECFVARPGKVLVSVDYDAFEMSTWAQACLDIVGESNLANILSDPKRDPHVEMGAMILGITSEEAYALKKADPKRFKEMRQLSKAANFGFPGGLGAERFVDFAEGTYGVRVTTEQARELKKKWFALYPEARPYFDNIADKVRNSGNGRARITHLRSERVRGGVGFCDGANSYFQGCAADAAKHALWWLVVEMYAMPESPLFGSRTVNFIHDEVIVETARERLREVAARQAEVQVQAAKQFIPDVRVSASPAAMVRWSKKAGDPVYNAAGELVPWEERVQ